MKSLDLAIEFAAKAQSYYPSQAYNTPAIMEFASMIHESDGKLLDIGCGDGQLLRVLSERYPNLAFSALTASKEESAACGPAFDVRVGDMHQLPWDDAYFDIVTARHSLEHSISPLVALFEINRVLRLGGRAYIVVPAPVSEWVMKWPDHFSVLPKTMWEKLFSDAGFEIETFSEGKWFASYSMALEPEYRFRLRKIRELDSYRVLDELPDDKFEPSQTVTGAILSPISEKRIVAVLHNLVLFDTIRPLLDRFRSEVKIIVPESVIEGFCEMARHTVKEIIKHGFDVELSRLPAEIRCEIELSPYPYANPNVREARWRIRFMYGLAKEAWNFSVKNNIYYDFVLTYGEYDTSILSALVPSYPVGNMKIRPVFSLRRKERPTLLYLPTYGPTSSIDIAYKALMELKRRFKIVSKAHHGTSFLEPERVVLLRELSDEYHDHATPLADLLETADVVISDGSGAIFDAIAAGVPVAVFQPKVFVGIGGTESLEERLCKEGIIPRTSDPAELEKVIDLALDRGAQAQNELRSSLFISIGTEAVDRAEKFLKELLEGDRCVPPAFLAARKELRKWLEQAAIEKRARVVAEQQLHQTYQRLTAQLIEDIKRNMEVMAERDEQARNKLELLQAQLNQQILENERLQAQLQQVRAKLNQLEEMLRWKRYRLATKLGVVAWYLRRPKDYLCSIMTRLRNTFCQPLLERVGEQTEKEVIYSVEYTLRKCFTNIDYTNYQGIIVVTSPTIFDETYNQRITSISKVFSVMGFLVVYLAWRWSKKETIPSSGEFVYKNIIQLPYDYMTECMEGFFKHFEREEIRKLFFIEFPHPEFLKAIFHAKDRGFTVIYEIIDHWGEFNKVGQAPWYQRNVEELTVLNADLITCINETLAAEFSDLRGDILIVPNALDLSIHKERIERTEKAKGKGIINLIYWGHLTPAWFDWDLVLSVAKERKDFKFHIIGYGEPENIRNNLPENVVFYGKIPPRELINYVRDKDVAIIPFKRSKLASAVDPIKLYEYQYYGLPVVTTGVKVSPGFAFSFMADDRESFIEMIEYASNLDVDGDAMRNYVIENHSYESRVKKILSKIGDLK